MILFSPSLLLSPYFQTSQLSQHDAKLCRHFTTVPVLRDSFLSQRLPLLFNNGLPFSQMPEMPISTIFHFRVSRYVNSHRFLANSISMSPSWLRSYFPQQVSCQATFLYWVLSLKLRYVRHRRHNRHPHPTHFFWFLHCISHDFREENYSGPGVAALAINSGRCRNALNFACYHQLRSCHR